MDREDVSICNNWLDSYRTLTVQNWDGSGILNVGAGDQEFCTAWLDVTEQLESVVVLTDTVPRDFGRALIINNPNPGSIPGGFTFTLVNAHPENEMLYLFYMDGNGVVVPAKMSTYDYSNPAAFRLYWGNSIRMTAVYKNGEFFWLRSPYDAW